MPAGIAVNVSHAKLNTQEKSAPLSADKKSSLKKSADEVNGKESSPGFKKLLDKKTAEKEKKQAGAAADKKNTAEIRKKAFSGIKKSADKVKPDPENPAAKKSEKGESEELKAENIISFNAENKKVNTSEADKTSERISSLVSMSAALNGASGLNRTAAGKEQKTETGAEKIRTGDKKGTEKKEASKKDNVKLQVLDLRTDEKLKVKSENRQHGSENSTEKFDILSETSDNRTESSQNQNREMLFVKADPLNEVKTDAPVKSLTAQQTAVLEKLKADGNSEIVKQTKIILNDNNSGELRMVLKPERLGFVRIKMNLDDNNIVGRIIVDNNNIKEIFENNMENLLRSFRESGFGSASLEVSVGGGKNRQQNMDSNERFFSKKIIEDVDSQNIVSRGQVSINAETLIDLVV